jgi:hypothetical protein
MLHEQGVLLAAFVASAVVIASLPPALLVLLCRAAALAMVLAGVAALPLTEAFLLGLCLVATGSVVFLVTLEGVSIARWWPGPWPRAR